MPTCSLAAVLPPFVRALSRRCPVCGARRVFRRWMNMAETCPGCDHRFERHEGYWIGAVAINTVATLAGFTAGLITVLLATRPDVPWTTLTIGGAVFNLVFPIAFYPISKTLWVALETTIHPLGRS